MKFGGTSVEDAQSAFARVADIVFQSPRRPVVVVSAMSGMTDALLASVQEAAKGELQVATASLDPYFARHLAVANTLLSAERQVILATIESAREEIAGAITRDIRAEPIELLHRGLNRYGPIVRRTALKHFAGCSFARARSCSAPG